MFYLKILLLLVHMVTIQCDRWGKCQWIDIRQQIYLIYFLNQLLHLSVKRVNERRYEFGDENGAESWVCAKIPHDGAIKKDCVPKVIEIVCNWLIAIVRKDLLQWCHQEESSRFVFQILFHSFWKILHTYDKRKLGNEKTAKWSSQSNLCLSVKYC